MNDIETGRYLLARLEETGESLLEYVQRCNPDEEIDPNDHWFVANENCVEMARAEREGAHHD